MRRCVQTFGLYCILLYPSFVDLGLCYFLWLCDYCVGCFASLILPYYKIRGKPKSARLDFPFFKDGANIPTAGIRNF